MDKSVNILLEDAKSKFGGYLALYSYRLMNLCIKAEPASLLSIEIPYDGTIFGIERFAGVSTDTEYSFKIFPHDNEALPLITKAILKVHPEFKQEIVTDKKISYDKDLNEKEEEVKILLITMPEVDDDRYKALKEGLDFLTKAFIAKIDTTYEKYKLKLTSKLAERKEEEMKEATDALDELYDFSKKSITTYEENKLEEIEDAHQKYLDEQAAKEQEQTKTEKAHGKTAGMSMRMFGEEDDE